MIGLLFQGQIVLFAIILFVIVFSLTFHEFGHAWSAKLLGDDTAERAGRLTLNPVAHIDPIGLLMVMTVGFGFAKPVPVSPHRLRYAWGSAAVAFAGPFMNLVLAVVCVNLLVWGFNSQIAFLTSDGAATVLLFLARINLLLMLFNLIPLGPLDGHYIMHWLLPRDLALRYATFNQRWGTKVFLGLIVLSIIGVPIFSTLVGLSSQMMPYLNFVGGLPPR